MINLEEVSDFCITLKKVDTNATTNEEGNVETTLANEITEKVAENLF